MPKRTLACCLLLLFSLATGSLPASALNVELNPSRDNYLEGHANDNGGLVERFEPASLPFADIHQLYYQQAVNETSYVLNDQGFSITFDEHFQPFGGGGAISRGFLYFAVDENVEYQLSGTYSLQALGDATEMELKTHLVDITGTSTLFENEQHSRTAGQTLVLGEEEGTRENVLLGSLTGTLIAGHEYRLFYHASIFDSASFNAGGTATGGITLSFVPEPTSASLFGLGLVGIAAVRRRH